MSSTSASTELRSRNADAMAPLNRGSAVLGNQMAFQELLHHGAHALMHEELGTDQQRHRHQETDVNLDVPAERDG